MTKAHDLHDDRVMEDLVEWVNKIAFDAIVDAGFTDHTASALADIISGGFEDLLVNHYGED